MFVYLVQVFLLIFRFIPFFNYTLKGPKCDLFKVVLFSNQRHDNKFTNVRSHDIVSPEFSMIFSKYIIFGLYVIQRKHIDEKLFNREVNIPHGFGVRGYE
jgi:hypothetical protein